MAQALLLDFWSFFRFPVRVRMNSRRLPTILLLTLLPCLALAAGRESVQVTLEYIAKKAEERARKPFRSPRLDLPAVLRQDNLDYDRYREIEFRNDRALWASGRHAVPHGILSSRLHLSRAGPKVNEFTLTHTQPIRFVQDFFNYRKTEHREADSRPTPVMRVFVMLNELNGPGRWDELGSFLGASYFRLLGKGQRYGQSARGLAIDSGEMDRPEEFPIFTDWWLGKPQKEDTQIRLYAILDSVSCVGAYEFLIQPGRNHHRRHRVRVVFPRDQHGRCGGSESQTDHLHRHRAVDEHVLVRQELRTQVR
jgi:glucans biosynthesis protein